MQYSTTHVHPGSHAEFTENHDYPQLPDFTILDWTNEAHRTKSAKISTWRTKAIPKTPKRGDSQMREGVIVPPSPRILHSNSGRGPGTQATHAPAIAVNARFSFASSEKGRASGPGLDDHVEVDVVPFHIFVDLGLALGSHHALAFVNEAINNRANVAEGGLNDDEKSDHDESEGDNTLTVTPQERSRKERETERQRLERLVLEDLDLDLDEGLPRWASRVDRQ